VTQCDKREAECFCIRTTRHKIHRCECGGSWVYGDDGQMQPRTLPGGYTDVWRAIDRYLFGWDR
jgi:hypothetical protein